MSGEDFTIIEMGASTEPIYDSTTHTVADPGSKETRDPYPHESVRAAVMAQKADRDPVERYRQRAEKNGNKLEDVLDRVSEFDKHHRPH